MPEPYPFPVIEVTVGPVKARAIVEAAMHASQWFEYTPWPDDEYRLVLKKENARLVEIAMAGGDDNAHDTNLLENAMAIAVDAHTHTDTQTWIDYLGDGAGVGFSERINGIIPLARALTEYERTNPQLYENGGHIWYDFVEGIADRHIRNCLEDENEPAEKTVSVVVERVVS